MLAATLAVAAIALTGCGTNISTEIITTTGTLSASATSLDVGSSVIGSPSGSTSVSFTNNGTKDILFTASPLSGGEFQIVSTTCGSSLAAGKSCSVTVNFTPVSAGSRSSSLSVSSGSQSATVTLRGTGLKPAALTASTATLVFPDTLLNTASAVQQITYTNAGDVAAPIVLSLQGNFQRSSSTCTQTIAPQASCYVTLTFLPLTRGANKGSLTASMGSTSATTGLSGNGVTPAHVRVNPTALEFPDTAVQTTSGSVGVAVTNDGDMDSPLSAVSVGKDFVVTSSNCAKTLPGRSQCVFQLAFQPSSSGYKAGTATITAGAAMLSVPMNGTGYTAAQVTLSATSMAFADTLVGSTSAMSRVTLTNLGDHASKVQVGAAPQNFQYGQTDCTSSLAGHAQCSISVAFAPVSSGSKTGALSLTTDAGSLAVGLSGNATAPVQATVPVLQSMLPASVTGGTSTTVHVTGTGLDTIDTMYLDGTATAFNHVSKTEITFQAAPPSWALQPISVVVHAPGSSGNSNALTLQIVAPPVSYDAAVRFTQQAAMSTTPDQIAQVQARGFSKWIDWQMTTPMYTYDRTGGVYAAYMNNAQKSGYALRQRVTSALKQIYTYGIADACGRAECGPYWEARLQQDALGNVRTLLYNVATSPLMGAFLQNANNFSAYPWTGTSRANANFAREFMQLMTIGPYKLNRDGSQVLDPSGQPVPTYSEENVLEAAGAMSGWTWGDISIYGQLLDGNPLLPMQAIESKHSPLAKNILPGVTIPAGQTAVKDMNDVVDTLFNHPNIAPFLCRRLIQHLVTSNPSPGYITRAVSVFENNGSGVRGDLAAIVKAILLDPEARRGDDPNGAYTQTETHYMEPVLFIANAASAAGVTFTDDQIMNVTNALKEDIFTSATVFGAYSPENKLPTGQFAPEVQLLNDASSLQKVAFVNNIAHGTQPGLIGDVSGSPLYNAASPQALVEQINHFLLHGTMPASLRGALTAYIADHPGKTANQMLSDMLVIALNSSAYQVLH